MTQAGIEPATFRFVAQHLNRCATAVSDLPEGKENQSYYKPEVSRGFQEVKVPRLRDNGTGWW